jgi:hypothetical protein
MKALANFSASGWTVVEPASVMVPESSEGSGCGDGEGDGDGVGDGVDAGACVVQPVKIMPITSKTARDNVNHFLLSFLRKFFLLYFILVTVNNLYASFNFIWTSLIINPLFPIFFLI